MAAEPIRGVSITEALTGVRPETPAELDARLEAAAERATARELRDYAARWRARAAFVVTVTSWAITCLVGLQVLAGTTTGWGIATGALFAIAGFVAQLPPADEHVRRQPRAVRHVD